MLIIGCELRTTNLNLHDLTYTVDAARFFIVSLKLKTLRAHVHWPKYIKIRLDNACPSLQSHGGGIEPAEMVQRKHFNRMQCAIPSHGCNAVGTGA